MLHTPCMALEALRVEALAPKGLARTLLALADTHEDLPFVHPSLPRPRLRRLLGLADRAATRLLDVRRSAGAGALRDDRDLAFAFFALSRLGVYVEEVFARGLELLAQSLAVSERLPAEGLRQWLLARNGVNHPLVPQEEEAVAQYPREAWALADHGRLHQLAGSLVFLKAPDPLLGSVIREINTRPPGQIEAGSRLVSLYDLQAVRLLSASGSLRTDARLNNELLARLDYWLDEKVGRTKRGSRLEELTQLVLRQLEEHPASGKSLPAATG